jgi:hypothetical protein
MVFQIKIAIMNILWTMSASLLGFSIAAIFAGWLKLQRNVYLCIYIPLFLAFIFTFISYNNLKVMDLITNNWQWGLLASAFVSILVIKNVISQPSSKRNHGFALMWDILWPGFAYGLVDALFLSVFPILLIKLAFVDNVWLNNWLGKISIDVIAFLSSMVVTAVYHLGYPEFRNKKVFWAMVGNGILSLAFLITMSPLAAIIPHIVMHMAAMIHGRETTGQVPPHYTH